MSRNGVQSIDAALGAVLAKRRAALKISVRGAAKMLGISAGSVSRYETGHRALSLDMLVRFSALYERKPGGLLEAAIRRMANE